MAVDLRYSWNRTCRRWLENVLTSLERQGLLEATLERSPRHYHVALFPTQYSTYVETLAASQVASASEATTSVAVASVATVSESTTSEATTSGTTAYQVRSGDSLWTIARRHGTTVDDLRDVNGIRGSHIVVGQLLDVPVGS
jgi:spore germination protein YaaH